MGFTHPIDAYADIIEADSVDGIDVVPGNQRAVAGETHIETHLLGSQGDIKDIVPQERLAAREYQNRHME